MNILSYVIWFIIGMFIGFGTMALFSANKDDDRDDYWDGGIL